MLSEHWSRLWGGDGRCLGNRNFTILKCDGSDTPIDVVAAAVAWRNRVWFWGRAPACPGILNLMSSRSAAYKKQGVAAGLRATANRLAAFALPLTMGLLVEIFGIAAGFWIVGGVLICATVSGRLCRAPYLTRAGPPCSVRFLARILYRLPHPVGRCRHIKMPGYPRAQVH